MIRSKTTYVRMLAFVVALFALDHTCVGQAENGDAAAPTVLERESVKIEPYQGETILLDEPPEPLPATIVDRNINAQTLKYPDGSKYVERQVTRYSDDRVVNDGTYREYHPNGQLFIEGQYDLGKPAGTWTYYHENGEVNRSVTYEKGKPSGNWDVLRADGSLMAKRFFKDGRRDGEWVEYGDDGTQVISKMHYKDGSLHGTYEVWYPSGTQKAVYHYNEGVRDGSANEWDDEGNKRAEANYKDGKFHGTIIRWLEDGRKFTQEFEEGRLISESTE